MSIERSEGGPQTARRKAGRSPKGDVGSLRAAGDLGAEPPQKDFRGSAPKQPGTKTGSPGCLFSYPRGESNAYRRNRNPKFYPLNYRGGSRDCKYTIYFCYICRLEPKSV